MANSSVVTSSERTRFASCSHTLEYGTHCSNFPLSPLTTALNTRETNSRNASPQTAENDRRRDFTIPHTPCGVCSSFTFQTVLSESWSCANTPVAPNSNRTSPMIVEAVPLSFDALFASMSWMVFALCSPTRSRSWWVISPRAASGPKIGPAIPITTRSIGASDRAV
jgi:hypothetical protein